jgi:hypothetical protein
MVTCALCRQPYDETALACRGKCPLSDLYGCGLLCCPHCGYQSVDEEKSTAARWLQRLWPARPAIKEVQTNDDA